MKTNINCTRFSYFTIVPAESDTANRRTNWYVSGSQRNIQPSAAAVVLVTLAPEFMPVRTPPHRTARRAAFDAAATAR